MNKIFPAIFDLTEREVEVLDAMLTTHSTAKAGKKLGLSARTVNAHLYNVATKMGTDEMLHTLFVWQRMKLLGVVGKAADLRSDYFKALEKLVWEQIECPELKKETA